MIHSLRILVWIIHSPFAIYGFSKEISTYHYYKVPYALLSLSLSLCSCRFHPMQLTFTK